MLSQSELSSQLSGASAASAPALARYGYALVDKSLVFDPYKPKRLDDRTTILPLFKPQEPQTITHNIVQVFKHTVLDPYRNNLLDFIKAGKWLCLNLEDFGWEGAIKWSKQTLEFVKKEKIGLVKQVVMADLDKLGDKQLITARTEFGAVRTHFRGYRSMTFMQAVTEFDKELEEANDFFNKVKERATRVKGEKLCA